ncbi:hypothetical protein [Clostridium brassicae]|uniref:Uncharacterized protein n=1 Tax=Clostridium brassicae TaxID=2999072 RepID=A0ABT4DFA9_9CLOT|nr:hypothetical protein [Clostridium brassicae]MCY6959791.1 hypothetical protein [Clostridium brassicae]
MRKTVAVAVSCLLFMSSTQFVVAKESNQNLKKSQKEIHESIQRDMDEYYKKYADKLMSFEEFANLNESKGNEKEVEDIKQLDEADILRSSGSKHERGTNDISYDNFRNGDIILVHDGFCYYGYWRHGAIFDEEVGSFISAQRKDSGNGEGVIYEPKSWYRNKYDKAKGVKAKITGGNIETKKSDMIVWLRQFVGKCKYSFLSPKNLDDNDTWYCTLLPWKGYKKFFDLDIDADKGPMCSPDDISNSNNVEVFVEAD